MERRAFGRNAELTAGRMTPRIV